MANNSFFYCFSCSVVLTIVSSFEKVPLLMWSNDRNRALPVSEQGRVGVTVTFEDLVNNYLNKVCMNPAFDGNIVIFLQDQLSYSDFARLSGAYDAETDDDDGTQEKKYPLGNVKSLMESMPVVYLPSVMVSPLDDDNIATYIRTNWSNVHVQTLLPPYRLSSLVLNDTARNVILVNLECMKNGDIQYATAVRVADDIMMLVTGQLLKLSKPFVAVYTAIKSRDQFTQVRQLQTGDNEEPPKVVTVEPPKDDADTNNKDDKTPGTTTTNTDDLFTNAVWTGLLTFGMLIAVVLTAVNLLFSIKVVDRFENPKFILTNAKRD